MNRALADDELDSFVDTLVGRWVCSTVKRWARSKPRSIGSGHRTAAEIQSSTDIFFSALGWPGQQARRARVRTMGYGVRSDFELNFGKHLPLGEDQTQRARAA